MATFTGHGGIVRIGSNTIAEVIGWSIEESGDVFEDTELSDTAKSFVAGQTSWTVSIECQWDDTDTNGQEAMAVGSTVALELYPEGITTGDYQFTGSAIVQTRSTGVAKGATVTRNFSLQGTGTLTEGTAT